MPKITIGSQVIDFPNTGSDAVWSESVVDFAVATAEELSGLTSAYDIPPNDSPLPNNTSFTAIANGSVAFPSGFVRSFVFTYSITRTNSTGNYIAETGTVNGVFNIDPGVNGGWKLNHQFNGEKLTDGSFYHSFRMNNNLLEIKLQDVDTVEGEISYSAKTLLKDY